MLPPMDFFLNMILQLSVEAYLAMRAFTVLMPLDPEHFPLPGPKDPLNDPNKAHDVFLSSLGTHKMDIGSPLGAPLCGFWRASILRLTPSQTRLVVENAGRKTQRPTKEMHCYGGCQLNTASKEPRNQIFTIICCKLPWFCGCAWVACLHVM